ncbi:hypothetical protein WJX77_006978 [Trebouxia sp. C0004]
MESVVAHVQHAHISSWAFHAHVRPVKLQRNITRTTRSSIVVKAEKNSLQRLLQPFEGFSGKEEVSFRWDPANLRWAKSKGKLADDAEMMITPLIGEPYMVWPAVHNYLQKKKLKTISPEEAYKMQQKNKAILVDVREAKYYKKGHASGCLNVGLFRSVEGRTPLDNLKRLAMAGFAMEATERNPNFRKDALAALPKNKTIAVMCSLGGTLLVGTKPREMSGKVFKSDPDRAFGRESRSLKACYELYEAGFKNIVHVDGGFPQWRYDQLPTEAEG